MKIKRIIYIYLIFQLFTFQLLASYTSGVEVSVLAKSTESWDSRDLPDYPKGEAQVTVLRIVIPAGTSLPMHKHPVINAAVVLKGSLKVIKQDGTEKVIHAGDALIELVNQMHYGKNEGPDDVELIVFYAGVVDAPLSEMKKP